MWTSRSETGVLPNHTQHAYTIPATAVFVKLPAFERHRARYLDDEGLRADVRRGKGKRGGLRVLYYWWEPGPEFWLFTLFDKDEMADLRPQDRKALTAMVKAELEAKRNV